MSPRFPRNTNSAPENGYVARHIMQSVFSLASRRTVGGESALWRIATVS